MPKVKIAVIEVDYEITYPSISFEVWFVVPHGIPEVGGKKYNLGKASISINNPSFDLPFSISMISSDIRFTLDPSHCEFTVSGYVKVHLKLYSHKWHIGPESIRYMTPFVLTEPPWSVNPVKIAAQTIQDAIYSAPANRMNNDSGASSVRNDAVTQDLIRGLFMFSGAGHFVDQMIDSAKLLAEPYTSQMIRGAETETESVADAQIVEVRTGGVVIAFAIGVTAGEMLGVSGSGGIYFTTRGDVGLFGTLAGDVGIIEELSAGFTVLVYWPDADQTAEQCFSGYNLFVAIDGGEVFTVGMSVYWPADGPWNVTSAAPCGISLTLGVGVGFPVNFYVGNSDTFKSTLSPPSKPAALLPI